MSRDVFIRAEVILNPRDLIEQPDEPARVSFGVRNAITRESLTEIFCLADVKHPGVRTAQEVNAGPVGQRAKEFFAEALDERSRRRE